MNKKLFYVLMSLLSATAIYGMCTDHTEVTLACGIFGQINKHKQGKFNFPAFTTLGIANDSRGGDSCGIFIDGKTEYGIDKTKLFTHFIETSKLLKSTTKCHIALGHCRKASVGQIDLQRAQPVVIRNDADEIEFVVIHNGTIYNYKALANKYIPDVDINGMSDSQVMAHIFYHTGFDVLNEYNGGAVFVIVDYRLDEPKVYAFKGKSKMYYTSATETDERPFYFTITKQTFYFSSIYQWLQPFTTTPIYTLEANVVTAIQDNDIYVHQQIDRSKCTQTAYTTHSQQNLAYTYAYGGSGSSYNYGRYHQQEELCTCKKIKVNAYGLYQFNNNDYVHGCYYVQPDGTVGYSSDALYCVFWNGLLLKNKLCFDFLSQFCIKSKIKSTSLAYIIPQTLDLLSYHPCCDYRDGDFYIYNRFDFDAEEPYCGKLQYLNDNLVYIVDNGVIVDCQTADDTYSLRKIYTDNLQFKLDTNLLNQVIINECNKQENQC